MHACIFRPIESIILYGTGQPLVLSTQEGNAFLLAVGQQEATCADQESFVRGVQL